MMSTSESVSDQAAQIANSFPDDVDLDPTVVESRLDSLINEYRVPRDEAERAARNHFLDEHDIDFEDLDVDGSQNTDDPAEDTAIASLDSADQWVSTTAKVVELWEPGHESIGQVGLLGDETATCKLTIWDSADAPEVEEGDVYRFENVVTDEYQGNMGVQVNSASSIDDADVDALDVGSADARVTGALVAIQPGSGLIKRCPREECTRVLQNGRCSEHGDVDGEFDLRIKAVIDNGVTAYNVIFDEEATEALTEISLEEAKQMAMDALDTEVVADAIRARVHGRFYQVTGPTVGQYLLVDECNAVATSHDEQAVRALGERVNAL